MIKNIFSFVVLASMTILISCAPQSDQNSTGRPKEDQVTEQAVNLLTYLRCLSHQHLSNVNNYFCG